MNTSALLGLLAETSIHAGAGQSGGVIDLPIQREAHTGWPVVYGSAVKGALRALAEENNALWLKIVFGPDTNNASEHADRAQLADLAEAIYGYAGWGSGDKKRERKALIASLRG